MVFIREKGIGFIHIPRTGGGTIERIIGAFENNSCGYGINDNKAQHHFTIQESINKWKFLENYAFYSLIRNPVDRFVSEYLWCEARGLGYKSGQNIDEFINSVSQIVKEKRFNETIYHDHFIPQVYFLINNNKIAVDHIFLFDELDNCAKHICERLSINSPADLPKVHRTTVNKPNLSSNQIHKIQQIYHGDLLFYNFIQKSQKNIFIMTSVVESLVPQRGIYDRSTRFKQCIETVKSIRNYCPGSKICWIEGSDLTTSESQKVIKLTDFYYNFNKSYKSKRMISFNKTIGECYLLSSGVFSLINDINNNQDWDVLVKISGRYRLNQEFNYDRLIENARLKNKITAKKYDTSVWDIGICYTFLYAIPRTLIVPWIQNMIWLCTATNSAKIGKRLLLIEANIMRDQEEEYLDLFTEKLGITARKWKNYNTEESNIEYV